MASRTLLTVSLTIGLSSLVLAQAPAPAQEAPFRAKLSGEYTPTAPPEMANLPTPRMPDGKPDISGPWVGGGSNGDIGAQGGFKGELPLLPWAKALRDSRDEKDEPYLYCTPMSVPRVNPYPWRFVQSYTANGPAPIIWVIHENGDAGAVRQIFMDGRKHPDPNILIPSWWGHSIGWWEGDTLVIDTVGYNDKFWFDSRGTPHTDKLHTIERFTRPNYGTLINEFTLDDPGAYSKTVQLKFTGRRVRQDVELMEDICTENNQAGIAGGYRLNTEQK
jgi:hypothetical protein